VPVLGITGGIATGKTFFTGCLARFWPALRVFDSDACARRLTASDPDILSAIREQFGPAVFDTAGNLLRPILREIVFADPARRKDLESILHPAIRREWTELAQVVRQRGHGEWLAVDIPLLFETSAETHFDTVVAVACSSATQRRRLADQRHLPPALAESMIASQLPLAEKVRRADYAVWNDGLPDAIEVQVRLLSLHLFS
jgi:dephospho-CoA kinase